MNAVTVSGVVMTHPRRTDMAIDLIAQTSPGFLTLAVDPEPTGPPTALRSAILAWSSVPTTSTHHLVLQDDAVLAPGFVTHVQVAVEAMPDAAIAFYTNWNSRNGAAVRMGTLAGASWVRATSEYTPTVALVLPKRAALGFAGYARRHGETWGDDVVMSRYLREIGLPTFLTVPNIVDHRDLPSLMDNGFHGARRSACFAASATPMAWSRCDDVLEVSVVPFFKHGVAQCAIRAATSQSSPMASWQTIDAERYCDRIGLSTEDLRKHMLEAVVVSDRLRRLAVRLGMRALDGVWSTAYLMGVVSRIEAGFPASGESKYAAQALGTIGPGGLCGDVGTDELAELQGDLQRLAQLGLDSGQAVGAALAVVHGPCGAARDYRLPRLNATKVLMTGTSQPLERYLMHDLADRGYEVTPFEPKQCEVTPADVVIHVAKPSDSIELSYPADGTQAKTVLRLGIPYGAGVLSGSVLEDFTRAALLGIPLRTIVPADRSFRFIHVQDVSLAIDRVLRLRPASGEFQIANARSVTSRELAEIVRQVVRPVLNEVTEVEPNITQTASKPNPAWAELGWQPKVGLADGIRALAQWLAYEAADIRHQTTPSR